MKIPRFMNGCLAGMLLLCGRAIVARATAADAASPKVADRAACSSSNSRSGGRFLQLNRI